MGDERWEMRDERWEMRDERWQTVREMCLLVNSAQNMLYYANQSEKVRKITKCRLLIS